MFIEFDNFRNFLLVSTKYNTFRVYRVVYRTLEALAQSQKNTYFYSKYYENEKELKEHVRILEENNFLRVKEIKRWEG
ncbi:MAG: hypothetical protein DRN03_05615 [Thermoplasmata archaeon]|nr:MAG: hypothetical protein DRN03_05615 [Thermoplasmata archaeon]